MKTMLSDSLDASRPATISIEERRRIDRRMHALMESFAYKGMNQEFIRMIQSDAHEPVASPPPARPRRVERDRMSARPREASEEPVEVKTPGVMAAEAAMSDYQKGHRDPRCVP